MTNRFALVIAAAAALLCNAPAVAQASTTPPVQSLETSSSPKTAEVSDPWQACKGPCRRMIAEAACDKPTIYVDPAKVSDSALEQIVNQKTLILRVKEKCSPDVAKDDPAVDQADKSNKVAGYNERGRRGPSRHRGETSPFADIVEKGSLNVKTRKGNYSLTNVRGVAGGDPDSCSKWVRTDICKPLPNGKITCKLACDD